MVAFTQVTFMYSIGLPILFLICVFNFTIMYWVDKYLLLRFHRIPKNYDEKTINFALTMMKFAFVLHAIIGFFMISNDMILTPDHWSTVASKLDDIGISSYSKEKYGRLGSGHTILFTAAMVVLVIFLLFESTFLEIMKKNCC